MGICADGWVIGCFDECVDVCVCVNVYVDV